MSLRILLADDSMTAQNMGKKILTDGGYDVVTVSNGAAAMKKLADFTPDVIIADVYMPGYNGLEICEKVKKAPATASVPVLLSVGKLEPFRPEEGLKVHADGIIIKPFEATDLLAVTAKLAERAGKTTAPAPPAPEPAAVVVEETAAPVVDAEPATPEPPAAVASAVELPAFAIEEPAAPAAPAYNFEPASEAASPAAFALDAHQPDYVREFGLDPHDAPTTGFNFAHDYVAATPEMATFPVTEPSFVAQLPEFEAATDITADEPTALAPASLNVAVNAVEFSAPAPEAESAVDTQDEPTAPVAEPAVAAEDDFEAKLAAAMAVYETPVADATAPVASVTTGTYDAASALEAVATTPYSDLTVPPTWVAEEAPLSDTEMGLSLEEELRAFSAKASASATASAPPTTSIISVPPVGPMGDTSFDDEVSSLVEQSKDNFFPSAAATVATEPAVVAPESDPVTFTERVNAVLDDAGFAPAIEPAAEIPTDALLETEPVELASFETSNEREPEPMHDSAYVEGNSLELDRFDAAPVTHVADVPELITHDIPADWNAPSANIEEVAGDPFEAPAVNTPAAELESANFVSHEAPFAHVAVDEVSHDISLAAVLPVEDVVPGDSMTELSAVEPGIETDVADEVRGQAMTEVAHAATTSALDETAISQIVENVMRRMKGDIVAHIVKELAAKLGK